MEKKISRGTFSREGVPFSPTGTLDFLAKYILKYAYFWARGHTEKGGNTIHASPGSS
jgi:hypothetical protein